MKFIYLFLLFSLVFLTTGCPRKDPPPEISIICIGDGFGGANCVLAGGVRIYKAPSELKNFWMTTEVDEANYSSWCYKIPVRTTNAAMAQIENQIKSEKVSQ